MSKQEDRIRFLSDPIRLRIAELCNDRACTRAELGAALEREAGSLSQPRTMVKKGALEERARTKASDGRPAKVYRLKRGWREALEGARKQHLPAWPEPGGDLLLVALADTATVCAAIAGGIPDIEWGAPVHGGSAGLVLAPSPRTDGASRIKVLDALREAAPQIMTLHLGRPMNATELRQWSSEVVGNGLPSGS
jgi:hypothetical protein